MSALDWGMLNSLKDWGVLIVGVACTLALAPTLDAFLRRFRVHAEPGRAAAGWELLGQLSRSLSYLLYPIGFRIALDAAPLGPKAELRLGDAVYLLFVLVFANLLRQAALVAIEWSAVRGPGNSTAFRHGFIPLLRNLVSLVAFLVGGILALKHFGYDAMSLITALGVGSLAVGLAAKDTLSNMISGFTLIIDQNLHPGDKINLAGSVGVVEEIGLRSTRLNMGDGNSLIVPNQELINTKIMNMSRLGPAAACSTRFRVPLGVPFQRIEAICRELHPAIAAARRDKGCSVELPSVSGGNQLVAFSFWARDSDAIGAALTDFHVRLVERLEREGIPLLGDSP